MKTTYHGKLALPSSARILTIDLLRHYASRRIGGLRTVEPIFSASVANAGRSAVRRLVGILILVAVLFSTSVAAAPGGRTAMKRPIASNASVQRISSERITSGQKARMDAVSSPMSFRAEDIVPDICKGCSP